MTRGTWASPVALLALCGALLLAGCGDSDDDTASSAKPDANPTDRAFIAVMVPHHASALEMAAIAKTEATSSFVRKLAASITRSQAAEIAQMNGIDAGLKKSGVSVGNLQMNNHEMGMSMTAEELRGAKPFDKKFIEMMIPHHQGAVEMSKVELSDGKYPELKALAQRIITTQAKEIAAMRDHLGQGGGSAGGHMDDDY
jgi:uncharacterized protein (DUF305 family)